MLRDVRYSITDGQLQQPGQQGTGIHVKIGASPVDTAESVSITGTMSAAKIKEKLGLSPLADAVMDSVENGSAKILCLPVLASTAGTVTEVTVSEKAGGTVTVEGTPYNAFRVIVRITGKGGLNTASFRYSLNGGYSWSDDITVPTAGQYAVEDAGFTMTFSTDSAFEVGDTFRFETTAPTMTNDDVMKAAAKLKDISTAYEYVHVVGAAAPELWAAVSVKQAELMERYRKPVFFVLEAYEKQDSETLQEYVAKLEADRKKVANYDIQVVAAWGTYTGMDGVARNINLANVVCGWYARASVQESIGRTAVYSVPEDKLSALLPEGIDEEYIEALDLSGYLTFRQYDGLAGYYVTNARVMCPENSDYRYAEDVRVKNKIIRLTRQAALRRLHEDVDLTDVDADLNAKAQFIIADVETQMVDKGEISAVRVIVPEGQDIQTTETLQMQIRYQPKGKIREFVIDLGMENPYAS